MLLKFTHNQPNFDSDLQELFRAFYPSVVAGDENHLDLNASVEGGELKVVITSDVFDKFKKVYTFKVDSSSDMAYKRSVKRHLKVALYRCLSFLSNTNLPYGCLTGIRPTKYFAELGVNAKEIFEKEFSVHGDKVKLVQSCVVNQIPYKNTKPETVVDVFVNIPFCPSRCAYCSFVSTVIGKQQSVVGPYIDCLKREISQIKKIIKDKKYSVRAVYVGGGTPTSLKIGELKAVLACLKFGQKEFTVEAGRPDTITKETVKILRRAKVTRISVNPQSFNQKTLDKIGRTHKVEDVINAYGLVRKKFDVNMDLIAMLPGETFDDFKYSVDKAIELSPENITVHTLCLKNGSKLKEEGFFNQNFEEAKKMVDYAYYTLTAKGYQPYYMYRQKYMAGNLENVGYSKPKKYCLYNIDVMEEDTSVLACGAGAISKKFSPRINLIERQANCKEPADYVKRFEEMLSKQKEFWEKNSENKSD